MFSDHLHEECGIFGIFSHPHAAHMTYLGLYALQHRGQESSGIATTDGRQCYLYKSKGNVHDVFNQDEIIDKYLKGDTAIGHNRYSTTGGNAIENIQPLLINFKKGSLTIAHNGNLTNTRSLQREMENTGSIFQTSMDSEVILHLIARSQCSSLPEMIIDALQKIQGAFSLIFMTPDCMIAARDPFGFRPLSIGKLDESVVIASESCAFDIINAEFIRDVEPGEVIVIEKDSIKSHFPFTRRTSQHCVFEYIYFARPDSLVFGEYVDVVRRRLGRQLAIDHPAEADIVMSVPDSS
ncbi:MAG: class II glutamine amidotransferase, partial [Candidatus Delongbacteria bacterium]|nr:class II glutamine amidotransferase [Candidatus Delongbacteria bacterium]